MKKIIPALFVFAFLFSCADRDSPKAVAEKFLKAVNSHDYDAARKYGTEETEKFLDMYSGFSKMMPDTASKDLKFEITRQNIDGDNAVIYYKEEGKEGEQQLPMIKMDGKWKVILSKESINTADEGNTMNIGATTTDTVK